MKDFSFGVFADVQYGQRDPAIGRDYRKAAEKVQKYLSVFQQEKVDFMIHMGDLIDEPLGSPNGLNSLKTMMDILKNSGIPCAYLMGNHDSGSVCRPVLEEAWGFEKDTFYFAFSAGNYRFLVLDSNYDENGIPYNPVTHTWDQCCIQPEQLQWLEKELNSAREDRVVVLCHALLDPDQGDEMVRNAEEVRQILEASGKDIIVLQGHKHRGDFSCHNGIPYFTLKGTVEQKVDRYYWLVHVCGDSMWADVYDNDQVTRIPLFPDHTREEYPARP